MKKLILILLIMSSCSKEETYTSEFHGVYAYPEYRFKGTMVELDINGETIRRGIYPVSGGIASEPFELPLGNNEVTRIEIFDDEGHIVYHVKDSDQQNALGGLVVTTVPFTQLSGNITVQIFRN